MVYNPSFNSSKLVSYLDNWQFCMALGDYIWSVGDCNIFRPGNPSSTTKIIAGWGLAGIRCWGLVVTSNCFPFLLAHGTCLWWPPPSPPLQSRGCKKAQFGFSVNYRPHIDLTPSPIRYLLLLIISAGNFILDWFFCVCAVKRENDIVIDDSERGYDTELCIL